MVVAKKEMSMSTVDCDWWRNGAVDLSHEAFRHKYIIGCGLVWRARRMVSNSTYLLVDFFFF